MQDVIAGHTTTGQGTDGDAPTLAFEYPRVSIVSYAQTREDVLLWRALHSVHRGFYIDVGAHDPTALSVTRAFYDHGWHGINVEPDPPYAEKLRNERPRDTTVESAVGQSPGMGTLFEFGDTGLSTLIKEIADKHKAAGFKATERPVSITTLAKLLDDLGDQPVHFLKIDVEGYELQVLRGADFAKVRPWIVLIEATRPMTTIATWGSWEPVLLEAGYEFVYFDGLNRFYVAREHRHLKRYFSVPVSSCDPFHDSKVVRLSEVISELQRDRMKHDVPRLGGTPERPVACDAQDAAALLRIVETQASDLVRLRRALLSAQTMAAQRLQAIHGVAIETIMGGNMSITDRNISIDIGNLGIYKWLRCAVLEVINRTQEAISDVVGLSRWRQIGQRLGLAKRMAWETSGWRTNLAIAGCTSGVPQPSIAELLVEFERLNGLLDDLRRSRWRKLGHWLGLARRLPWESGKWRDPLLLKPFPAMETKPLPTEQAERHLSQYVRAPTSLSRYIGYAGYISERFLEECRGFATDVILDIGANTGQFAQGLRAAGYQGHMISFEPLSDAHATLAAAADSDPLWDVAERCAVGADDGWAEINIAGNSYSSSLLPMLDLHRKAAPESVYSGTEPCRVITLDSYIDQTFSDPTTLFGLKIDTQGYEAQVLAGLRRNHDRVKVIVCEMSLAPLYADGPSMSELCHLMAELDYRCIALGPGFEDPRTGELLRVDGIFVKRG
jgi:FkbM family methyltransferase